MTRIKNTTKLGARVIASVNPRTTSNKVKVGTVVGFGKNTASVSYTHKSVVKLAKAVKHENILVVPKGFRVLKNPRLNCAAYIPVKNRILMGKVTKITPHQVDVHIPSIATTFKYGKENCIFSK